MEIDRVARGEHAERLLEDELLNESLSLLEQHAMSRLKAADVNDTKTLQTLVMGLQAASGFRRQLELAVRDGADALEKAEKQANSPFRRMVSKVSNWT